MKSLMKSATESSTGNSVGRFIYRENSPAQSAEAQPDPREVLEDLALDETQRLAHEHALGIALRNWTKKTQEAFTDVNDDMEGADLFEITAGGNIRIQAERALGSNVQRNIIGANELAALGIDPVTAVAFFAAHVSEFRSIDDNGSAENFGSAVMGAGLAEVAETDEFGGAVVAEPEELLVDAFGGAVLPGQLPSTVTFDENGNVVRPNAIEDAVAAGKEAAANVAAKKAADVDDWLEAQTNGSTVEGLDGYNDAIAVYNGTADRATVVRVQQALVGAGVDLGNTGPNNDGVDGINGRKTKSGVQNTLIPQIQQALTDAGFDTGGVSNGWGPKSTAALAAAQENDTSELEGLMQDPANREIVKGLLAMTPTQVEDVKDALNYFGVPSGMDGEVTPALIVNLKTMAAQEGLTTSPENLATAVSSMGQAYNIAADKISEDLQTIVDRLEAERGDTGARGLDARKAILENHLVFQTMGYPQLQVIGEGGPDTVNNGLSGRLHIHKHRASSQNIGHTDNFTVTTANLDGQFESQTISYDGRDTVRGPVTSETTVSQVWEPSSAENARAALSAQLYAGTVALRPSREMISRLFDRDIHGQTGVVTLTEDPLYTATREWAARPIAERVDESVNITTKFVSTAWEQIGEAKTAEISSKAETAILERGSFGFNEFKHIEGQANELIARVEANRVDDGNGDLTNDVWNVDVIGANGAVTTQKFTSWEALMASEGFGDAREQEMRRWLGVQSINVIGGGLRPMDAQGLVRCGEFEDIVLLEEPTPGVPDGYNFIRNGLPCGVQGPYCTSSQSYTPNVTWDARIDEHVTDKWTPTVTDDGDGGGDGGGDGCNSCDDVSVGSTGTEGTSGDVSV